MQLRLRPFLKDRNEVVELHLAAKAYGRRPSELLNGSVHDLNLDLSVFRIGNKAEIDAIKKK